MGQSAYPNFQFFEILQVGVVSVSISSSPTNWTTVAHNLGYPPTPQAILNGVTISPIFTNGNVPLPSFISASITGGVVQHTAEMFCASDSTNLYVVSFNGTGGSLGPFFVKYYLLRERASK